PFDEVAALGLVGRAKHGVGQGLDILQHRQTGGAVDARVGPGAAVGAGPGVHLADGRQVLSHPALGHVLAVGGARPETAGAVAEETGLGIHRRVAVPVDDQAVAVGVPGQLVALDVAHPAIALGGPEQRVVEVVAIPQVVVGADRHAGRREAGVLGQDLDDDRLHRLGEAGHVAGGEVLAPARLGGVLQQLLVGGEADGVGVDHLFAGHSAGHVLIGHVFGQVRQALAIGALATGRLPVVVCASQGLDERVGAHVPGRLAVGQENDVGALAGMLDGADIAAIAQRVGHAGLALAHGEVGALPGQVAIGLVK